MRSKLIILVLIYMAASTAFSTDADWPRVMEHPKARIVMYQPQIEEMTADDVAARAAVSVTPAGEEAPHFGAVWINARLEVDRDQRTVGYRNIEITQVRFPEASDENKKKLAAYLEQQMPTWDLVDDLDVFIPLIDEAEHAKTDTAGLNNSPPNIVHATQPTILVTIDGEPRFKAVTSPEKSVKDKIKRLVNSPYPVFHSPKKARYYLHGGGDLWYEAESVLGPYKVKKHWVPSSVKAQVKETDKQEKADDSDPPLIVTATVPTELILTDGETKLAPVADLDLLYVSNSSSDIVVDMASRQHYALLSGRWYMSPDGLEGPWSFVEPAELPEVFNEIPPDSDMAGLRVSVPGTPEAQEAVLDNIIPQTAAIKRDDHSLRTTFDGEPTFSDIPGTGVAYATNSPQAVFKVDGSYFSCEQGVWYQSHAAVGPWIVATEVPDQVYEIPASNPHHNVTYVKVYDVTPEVVYVGYTPAYFGSYVYGGCVVYGTGWYYPGWYGHHYYPYHSTWGFRASYNPWYGWGLGVTWSNGPFTVTFGTSYWGSGWGHSSYYHGWWGPVGYRPYYSHHHHHLGHYPPSYRRPGGGTARPRPGSPSAGPRPRTASTRSANNLYAQDRNRTRNVSKPAASNRVTAKPGTVSRPNNVYADRGGNIHRRESSGSWQSRSGGQWKPSTTTPSTRAPSRTPSRTGSTRPSAGTRPSTGTRTTTRPSGGTLSGDYRARSRGQARSGQYRSTRPSGGLSRSGSAGSVRSGGRRR